MTDSNKKAGGKSKAKDFSANLTYVRKPPPAAAIAASSDAATTAPSLALPAAPMADDEIDASMALALRMQEEGGILQDTPFTTAAAVKAMRPLVVRLVKDLIVHPNNPRPVSAAEDLDQLASDMQAHGQREPIHIVPYEGSWAIMEGQRRWRAAQLAGIEKLDCFEHPQMDPLDVYTYGRAIHSTRNDTCAIDDAIAWRKLLDHANITRRQLIARLAQVSGKAEEEASFSKKLAITACEQDLIEEIKKAPKRFTFRHLYALTQIVTASHTSRAIDEARRVIYAPEESPVTAVSLENLAKRLAESAGSATNKGRRTSTAKVIHGTGGADVGVVRVQKSGRLEFTPGKNLSMSAEMVDEMHATVSRCLMEFFANVTGAEAGQGDSAHGKG